MTRIITLVSFGFFLGFSHAEKENLTPKLNILSWEEKAVIDNTETFQNALKKSNLDDHERRYYLAFHHSKKEEPLQALNNLKNHLINLPPALQASAAELYLKTALQLNLPKKSVAIIIDEIDQCNFNHKGQISPQFTSYLASCYLHAGHVKLARETALSILPENRTALSWWALLRCSALLDKTPQYKKLTTQLEDQFGLSSSFSEELILADLDHYFFQGNFKVFETLLTKTLNRPDGLNILDRMLERIETWATVADKDRIQSLLDELNVILLSSSVVTQEEIKITLEYLIASLELQLNGKYSSYLDSGLAQDALLKIKKKSALLLAQKAVQENDESLLTAINQFVINRAPEYTFILKLNIAKLKFNQKNYEAASLILNNIQLENNDDISRLIQFNQDLISLLQEENKLNAQPEAEPEPEVAAKAPTTNLYAIDHLLAQTYLNPNQSVEPILLLIEQSKSLSNKHWNSLILCFVDISLQRNEQDYLKYRELLNSVFKEDANFSQIIQYWTLLSKINLLENEYTAALEALIQLENLLILEKDLMRLKMAKANTLLLNKKPQEALAILTSLKQKELPKEELDKIYYLSGTSNLLIGEGEALIDAQKYFENLITTQSPYQDWAKYRIAQILRIQNKLPQAVHLFQEIYTTTTQNTLKYQAAAQYVQGQIKLTDPKTESYEDIALVCDGVLSDSLISKNLRIEILSLKANSAKLWGLTQAEISAYEKALEIKTTNPESLELQMLFAQKVIQHQLNNARYQDAHSLANDSVERFPEKSEFFRKIAKRIYLEQLIWEKIPRNVEPSKTK